MRILIAEDEKDLNRIITGRLKEEHYSVDSCYDGQEALEYLESAGVRCGGAGYHDAGDGRPDSTAEDAAAQ